jgi:Leucine-rich repeat (LRR) protein
LQVIKGFFTDENSVLFRYKASNKLTKVLGKIDEIVTEMNQFNFTTHPPVNTIDRETQSSVMESEVIGREGERDEIVNALLDPQRERDDISVLAIVGMGGLGKTTLAQLVFNHEGVKGRFQLLMWVCVSTDFNVVNILKLIIQAAQKGGDISASSKEVLQQRLHEILDKKKYLLVLDDVWNETREKWEEMKTLLSSRANAGSVVIVTTRSKMVATIMGTLPDCDLAKLTEEDSWKLFEKRAFGWMVTEPSEELHKIGRNIVRKCGGLPLAVKAMGGLMGTKPDVKDWRVVAENNKIWDGLASSENILALLKLSYDHLPSYMKQCFVFCAVFPQDYLIKRDMLIRLWMANDFIPTDSTMDLEDKGRHIFNELYLRSFFQDIEYKEDRDYGSITTTCKMHDLMHDLATQVAGKKCSTQLEQDNSGTTQEEVQHLLISLDYSRMKNIEASVLKQLPNVRTFLVLDQLKQTKKYSYLLKSSSLRALQFEMIDISPPKELGYMRHLRYLDLSFCDDLHALPESISKLYNLQTLNVSHSEICELPEGMRYLTNLRDLFLKYCGSLEHLPNGMRYMTNLRHVCLDGCNNLKWMPIGIGQLKCLRILTKYAVDPDKGGSIGELKILNDLYGHLSLSGLEKIRDKGDAEAANFAAKSKLYSLELRWEGELRETGENEQAVLEALGPHSELKFLKINGFLGSSFPKWIKEPFIINNLKTLRLIECINYVEISPVLQLHLLEELYLQELKSLTYIVTGSCKNADEMIFPSLKRLEMVEMPNLEGWNERDIKMVNFPNLESLKIDRCPKLKSVPIHAPLLTRLKVKDSREIKLRQILNISMLSYLDIKIDFPPTETDAFRLPKTLEELRIMGFENVNHLADQAEEKQSCEANALRNLIIVSSNCFLSCGYGPGRAELGTLGFWKHFAALEFLVFRACKSLVYWPQEEMRNLKCLKELNFEKCEKFTGSLSMPVSSSPILIPQLKWLSIENCPELVQIPSCSTSLEHLVIDNCPKFFYGEGVLASLTELQLLYLSNCINLRAWPDNMGHLPSLKDLRISNCPGIESFPESLQQRLPSLQYLFIYKCPALERRCRRGGDYSHLVSSIPRFEIHEKITKSQSILGRLLPRRMR